MPTCPCTEHEQTCVDAASPLTRVLNPNDCVQLGFTWADSPTVDHGTDNLGRFRSNVRVSPNANNGLQALNNGLYIQVVEDRINDLIVCREGSNNGTTWTPSRAQRQTIGSGLYRLGGPAVDDCDNTADDALKPRLWAPPPLRHLRLGGGDSGDFKFSPLASASTIASGTLHTGDRASNGLVMRRAPHTNSAGNPASGLFAAFTNLDTVPMAGILTADSAGGEINFSSNDTWDLRFYHRAHIIDSNGNTDVHVGDYSLTNVNFGHTGINPSGVYIPSLSIPLRIAPGSTFRVRFEQVVYAATTGSNPAIFPNVGRPTLRVRGLVTQGHDTEQVSFGSLQGGDIGGFG